MPNLTVRPRVAFDVALAALLEATVAYDSATARITEYEADPARAVDGLKPLLRWRIRQTTTAKNLRIAAEQYRDAKAAYLKAYPHMADKLRLAA